MNVLLSIKPRYVEKIISGEKKYEFRRTIFKNDEPNSIFVYSSSPVGRIIGEMIIDSVLSAHPRKLWEQCKESAGIARKEFFRYFEGKEEAYALKIRKMLLFHFPIEPKRIKNDFVAPQSYYYIRDELMSFLNESRSIMKDRKLTPRCG